jgi:hypothetical protein
MAASVSLCLPVLSWENLSAEVRPSRTTKPAANDFKILNGKDFEFSSKPSLQRMLSPALSRAANICIEVDVATPASCSARECPWALVSVRFCRQPEAEATSLLMRQPESHGKVTLR